MKISKHTLLALGLIVFIAAIYRVIPFRPFGFAPQIAIALFAGAVIKDKKWAVLLPLLSMFISDLMYQMFTDMPGFYGFGQIVNYALIGLVVFIGMYLRKVNVQNVVGFSLIGSGTFFLLSNAAVWIFGTMYPKTIGGLMASYAAGLPFFRNAIAGDLVFCGILFGGYYLVEKYAFKSEMA